MKLKINFFALTFLLISCQTKSQNRIQVNIPSLEMETAYVWRTIQDINFFEKNKYQISLPKGLLINNLKVKSKLGNLTDKDYDQLKTFIRDRVYNINDYQKGYEKIKNQLPLMNTIVNEINQLDYTWDFKKFDVYQVNLTLYGPGGSYDPDEGSILIFTTTEGQFKSYDNPANTIIHEITHIGIEESIVNKYQIPHALKERIVDTFVFLNFNTYLTKYRIQDMGEKRTDQYLKTKVDLKNLDRFIEILMKSN